LIDDSLKRVRLAHGKVSEHLSIEIDVRCLQAMNEAGVRQPMLSCRCIDSLGPQPTKVSLS
jgi:hypothetical protein